MLFHTPSLVTSRWKPADASEIKALWMIFSQRLIFGSLSNVGVSSNSSTTHGRERFLLTSVFILISPSKAAKSENGTVQSYESQMLLSLTP